MDQILTGQKALITGGSKGIGFAVARAMLDEGAQVAICGRNRNDVDKAVTELSKEFPKCVIRGQIADVGKSEDVRELFEFVDAELGPLNILVNNAGSGAFRPAAELSVEEWDQVISTNLSGAFYCSREALIRYRTDKGGWVINISSLAGKNPFAGGSAYNASKFGLNGFSEAMMLDHRSDNVRVSYIMPGSVDTGFSGQSQDEKSTWKIAPEDVAEIVIDILRKPKRTLVSRVEVRPSKPAKS